MSITKAIHRQPTGFRDPEYRDYEVDVLGFAHGTIEDMSRTSGTITGMMAVCIKGGRFETIPISQLCALASTGGEHHAE